MFWLIENSEQLNNLDKMGYKEAFIEPVGMDSNKHPVENPISFIYFHPKLSQKGYIISINHNEAFSLKLEKVIEVLKKYDVLYTTDKKTSIQYLKLNNLWDIIIPPLHYPNINNTKSYENFLRTNINQSNLNYIYPLSKQYEYFDLLYNEVKDKCFVSNTKYAKFYNNKVSLIFAYIESSGIKVNKEIFEDFFHKIDRDVVFTKYNIKTTTTRPSNSFNGVNYAALNKKNGCRKAFIPTEGNKLVEFDFTAYHPSLIAKLIDYDFKGENIHTYFSNLYNVDYNKAKELTFKQIYGNVFPQYSHLEFFQKLKNLIKNIWDEFDEKGYYECPISNYVFVKDLLENMNPSKLFNYVLQNLETSNNINMLWDVIKLLKGKKSKLILYTYDSFMFDFNIEDKQLIKDIKNIFKKNGFQYKINYGDNYDF